MEIICLKGQVTKLIRVPGKKMRVRLLEHTPGKEIDVKSLALPKAGIRRGTIVSVRGKWSREGVLFVTAGDDDISPAYDRKDLPILIEHGFPDADYSALLTAFEMHTLVDLFWHWAADPAGCYERAVPVVGEEIAGEIDSFVRLFFSGNDMPVVVEMLDSAVGLSLSDALEVYDFLIHRAARRHTTVAQLLHDNPYMLCESEGRSVREADDLYRSLYHRDPEKSSVNRAIGVARYVLWLAARNGDAYLPYGIFIKRVKDHHVDESMIRALFFSRKTDDVEKVSTGVISDGDKNIDLVNLTAAFMAVGEGDDVRDVSFDEIQRYRNLAKAVYLKGTFFSEFNSSSRLIKFLSCGGVDEHDDYSEVIDDAVNHLSGLPSFDPKESASQIKAISTMLTNRLTVVNGPAGTGKSEMAAAVIAALRKHDKKVLVVSPTGIGAQRLSLKAKETYGVDISAMTLHLSMNIGKEASDLAEPGSIGDVGLVDADVVIVDEAAMMDVVVFDRLMWRLSSKSVLVLIGDINQLGAAGPGRVMEDLIQAIPYLHELGYTNIDHVTLDIVHRAKGKGVPELVSAAHGILAGNFPRVGKSVKIHQARSKADAERMVRDMVNDLLAQDVPLEDILVVTPYKKAKRDDLEVVSADVFNQILQIDVNNGGAVINGTPFRVNDRVLCVKNDYLDGDREVKDRRVVYNGEVGRIVSYDRANDIVTVDYNGDLQKYSTDDCLQYLELAYALTVHKAQGGEAPVVIFVCTDAGRLANKRLFYTAVTRCKLDNRPYSGKLHIITTSAEVREALMVEPRPRWSKLLGRVLLNAGLEPWFSVDDSDSGVVVHPVGPVVSPEPMVAKPSDSTEMT